METTERTVAKALLDIKAVSLSSDEPFVWASGWKSPIYCDNRRILSYPEMREYVCRKMVEIILEKYPDVGVIAGVATGAIAWGALIAHFLGKPFIFVRPKPKDHGLASQIEGVLNSGDKVVVVEDLISTGGSSLSASMALKAAGAHLLGMVAILSYNFVQARKSFENDNVELTTLTDYDTLIDVAVETGYIRQSDLDLLKNWRFSPSTWGEDNI